MNAIKINTKSGRVDAYDEINILEAIARQKDHLGKKLCALMESNFDYCGHICIVFECFGLSIDDYMAQHDNIPLPMTEIQDIAYQIVYGVKCKLIFYIINFYTKFIIFFT